MTDTFDAEYLTREAALEEKQKQLFDKHEELKQGIRKDVTLDDDARADKYIAGYQALAKEIEDAANRLVGEVEHERSELEALVHEGRGERFGELLVSLANVSDERLREVFNTALRTQQPELAQAAAQAALERNQFGLLGRWAQTEPERAEALRRLRTLPDTDRLINRIQARKFIGGTANPATLKPQSPEDKERERMWKAAEAEREQRQQADKESARRAVFFGGEPMARRQAGRRVYGG